MIGIFDSGAGGLTVLKAIRDVYPSTDVVYFGDTKNAPYGQRSRAELSAFTFAGFNFLLEHGASAIVSACNSVSASLVISLYDMLPVSKVPVIEMVGPTVSSFKGRKDRVALCATVATIESGMYQNAFRMLGKEIIAFPIPDLAGAIEKGEREAVYEGLITDALANVDQDAYDTLVLGCTHYPLVQDIFSRVSREKEIFDPAQAVAGRVLRDLWPREMGYGKTTFYISSDSQQFRAFVAQLLPGEESSINVVS